MGLQAKRAWYATGLGLLGLTAYVACGETVGAHNAPDASDPGTNDGSAVVSPDVSVTVQGDAAPPECFARLVPTSDCKHPPVVRSCENGYCTIPPGCFVVGSPECQPYRGGNSEPEAQVSLTHKFEIGQHEVTQGEWAAMGLPVRVRPPMPDGGSTYGGCVDASCPVNFLSWFDALVYANRVSRAHNPPLPECYVLEGCTGAPGEESTVCTGARTVPENVYECRGYRLPTENEWEYAARGGTRTPYYSGRMYATECDLSLECHMKSEPNLDKIAWYCSTATSLKPYFIQTRPVMLKAPNDWGLYDMLGNVAEWTSDVYDGLGYRRGPYVNPGDRLGTGRTRTKRGGGASSAALTTTASNRLGADWNGFDAQGIRLVRTLE